MLIQYIATGIILIVIAQLFIRVFKDKTDLFRVVFWFFFWGLSLFLIWMPPDVLDTLGEAVGVGRGVDVLIYLSVITLFYVNLKLNSRIEKLEKQITKLVREMAKSKA
jgi:hypothetical protein